jgi:tetratricopeptide (TPR) repeat protein
MWELLSNTLLQAGENSSAAESFEKAAVLAESEGRASAPSLLGQAGSAWLEARNLVAAGSVYDRLVKLSPPRANAYLGRAKTHRYNNERLKALEFLLDSLVTFPDAEELKEELKFLVDALLADEIERAIGIVEANKEKRSAVLALDLLQKRRAGLTRDEIKRN